MRTSISGRPVAAIIGRHRCGSDQRFLNDRLWHFAGHNLFGFIASALARRRIPGAGAIQNVDVVEMSDGTLHVLLRCSKLTREQSRALCGSVEEPVRRVVANVLKIPSNSLEVKLRQDPLWGLPEDSLPHCVLRAVHELSRTDTPRLEVHFDNQQDAVLKVPTAYCDRATLECAGVIGVAAAFQGQINPWDALPGVSQLCIAQALEVTLAGQDELCWLTDLMCHPASLGRTLLIGPPDQTQSTAVLDLDHLRRHLLMPDPGDGAQILRRTCEVLPVVAAQQPRFKIGGVIRDGSRPDLAYRVEAFSGGMYHLTPPHQDSALHGSWMLQSMAEARHLLAGW